MRRVLAYAGLWASIPVIAFAVVYVGLALASRVGASTVWTGSTSITSPFYTAWTHHQYCGKHTSGVKRGYYGNYRQTFAHCSMTFSTVYVTRLGTPTATPRPTRIPPPVPTATPTALPTATATPTTPAIAATATPTEIPATSTPVPTATSVPIPSPDPVAYELSLMNTTRAQYGLPPYSINPAESTCSLGHSEHMASVGYISHDQFPADICVPVRSAGENVGMAGGYSVNGALDVIHQEMLQEPYTPGCTGNHHCAILSVAYTEVGIGIYQNAGGVWLTVDFLAR